MKLYFTVLTLASLSCNQAFDYCTISPRNTLCLYSTCRYGPNCFIESLPVPSTIPTTDREYILKLHNDLRRSAADGFITDSGQLPPASKMRELVWDDELALMAQTWANQCTNSRDENRDVSQFAVGQNVLLAGTCADAWNETIADPYTGWVNGSNIVDQAYVQTYTGTLQSAEFTQMIWADTYKVGCGVTNIRTQTGATSFCNSYYVCNYGPAGNQLNQPIYQIGPTASACPPGTLASDRLCAIMLYIEEIEL